MPPPLSGTFTGRRRLVSIGLLVLMLASVALAVPGVEDVLNELSGMDPGWIAVAAALELASCLSFVAIFRHFFPGVPARPARQLAWTGMASNALLPGGGVGGLAVSGWLLQSAGMPTQTVIRRSSGLFFLTSAINVGALVALGALLAAGLASGPHDFIRAGVPVLGGVAVIAVVVAALVRRPGGRVRSDALAHLIDGARDAMHVFARPDWRLLGAAGYLLFDIAALWAAFLAAGEAPPIAALALAYIIGYIANVVPMPGGIGVLDAGLMGALIAYGASATHAAAAVLVYHAIVFWLPGLGGVIAFASLRRRLSGGWSHDLLAGTPGRAWAVPVTVAKQA